MKIVSKALRCFPHPPSALSAAARLPNTRRGGHDSPPETHRKGRRLRHGYGVLFYAGDVRPVYKRARRDEYDKKRHPAAYGPHLARGLLRGETLKGNGGWTNIRGQKRWEYTKTLPPNHRLQRFCEDSSIIDAWAGGLPTCICMSHTRQLWFGHVFEANLVRLRSRTVLRFFYICFFGFSTVYVA